MSSRNNYNWNHPRYPFRDLFDEDHPMPGHDVEAVVIHDGMPLPEALEVLDRLRDPMYHDTVVAAILNYTIRIYGLPDCALEDVLLAANEVFEERLGVQPMLVMGCRFDEGSDRDITGVLFKYVECRRRVLARSYCLRGTGMRIERNTSIRWVLDNWPDEIY